MQVIAFATPPSSDWRWRIVNYGGEMLEESSTRFPSIASALAEGARRLQDLNARAVADRFPSPLR